MPDANETRRPRVTARAKPEALSDDMLLGMISKQLTELIHEQREEAQHRVAISRALAKKEAEIPAPLRWAAGIVAALFTAGIATLAGWLVFTVSDMQVTLALVAERQTSQTAILDGRFGEIDRRLDKIEQRQTERDGQ
jgi:hypothetical protein